MSIGLFGYVRLCGEPAETSWLGGGLGISLWFKQFMSIIELRCFRFVRDS